MTETPQFPPLFNGLQVESNPFSTACAQAETGCDAGLVVYQNSPDSLRAALVFAPDVALSQAMMMLPICGVGFQNALGALAPPEVGVHLGWSGAIKVNGGTCGGLSIAASRQGPADIPNWLVVGLEVPLWPQSDNPGDHPDETALYAEGCTDVTPMALLEAWVRHSLVWINRWSDDGASAIHAEWKGLADGLGKSLALREKTGIFMGVDELFGAVIKDDTSTSIVPLTSLLERKT